jgi:hypothetical protein
LAALVVLFGMAGPASAQTVGEVEFSRGAAVAQSPGKLPRTMGRGQTLAEGDRLTTAAGAMAIVRMQDGSRLTLRPDTELVLQNYRFNGSLREDNSMVMRLLRGGLRAITGLISKGSPTAASIQTPTATIGIRGTDFDARLCGPECKAEAAKVRDKPRPNAVLASAKVVGAQGAIHATDSQGQKRALSDGGSVYPGDVLQTGPGARALLAFRDDSRLTLGADTRFQIESFVFDQKAPQEGRFLVRLLQGSLRALTGLIGKSDSRNVGFATPTATVGIRGTGLDLDCANPAACSFFTWLGSIEVSPQGSTALQVLQAGQGLYVGPEGLRELTAPTLDGLPRPDTVPVDMRQLFSTGDVSPDAEGLFVFVRDGHIQIASARGGVLDLGRGETGFAGPNGEVGRPQDMPLFIQFDNTPMPNSANPMLLNLLHEAAGGGADTMCR